MQAYQKRALRVLEWLGELARGGGRTIPVRLVKGAYWDSEIKRAQELGLDGYPVFTRKCNTDVSYLACAKALLTRARPRSTRSSRRTTRTPSPGCSRSAPTRPFELQRLHGMGEELYGELLERPGFARRCRVYAPVGSHEHLLPYLVRRLLENGANTSFVNRLVQAEARHRRDRRGSRRGRARAADGRASAHPAAARVVSRPSARTRAARISRRCATLEALAAALGASAVGRWRARPRVDGADVPGAQQRMPRSGRSPPRRRRRRVRRCRDGAPRARRRERVRAALERDAGRGARRAAAARGRPRRGGPRGARRALRGRDRQDDSRQPRRGPRGRRSLALLRRRGRARARGAGARCQDRPASATSSSSIGRGVFFCVSPWNFPLAIFTGQVAAALAAGNTVIAKPAEQGTLVAARAVALLEQRRHPAGRAAVPAGRRPRARRGAARATRASRASRSRAPSRPRARSTRRSRRATGRSRR